MDFKELQDDVFGRLEENSVSPDYYSLAEVKGRINRALEFISEETGGYVPTLPYSLALQANVTYYALGGPNGLIGETFVKVWRIFNPQFGEWMAPSDERRIEKDFMRWNTVIGNPKQFWIKGAWMLGIYPKVSMATGTLSVVYGAVPAPMVADADQPWVPGDEFREALVAWAVGDLLLKTKEAGKATAYFDLYTERRDALFLWLQRRNQTDRTIIMGAEG